MTRRSALPLPLLALSALSLACADGKFAAQADSARAAAAEQTKLAAQLSAQKDSLTNVVLQADEFISKVDSQLSKVKGLPDGRGKGPAAESPIQEQIEERKAMLARVEALVQRARTTAAQLAESRRREKRLKGENEKLVAQVDKDEKLIADLGATIERQVATIATLQTRVDSLVTENQELYTATNRAYVIVGKEKDLLQKGVIVREGGANLLVARVGRSVQPARKFDPSLFTRIDQRNSLEITVPDTTREYKLVSRQSLDNAEVAQRKGNKFRGHLHIKDPQAFWAQSRYLILVEN
jgi:predicted  nucleic acid-binding Zn-ribbon protein